jgi:hypothetical protein
VGPRAVLDAVVKTKIPSPCRESNPIHPIAQPITTTDDDDDDDGGGGGDARFDA